MIPQQVFGTIQRHRMARAGDRVGVGVSGGADSVALLLLLEELRAELGITLLVLHFNHRLRGADAEADQQFVAELAAQRGLEFFAGSADVAAEARRQGANLEEVARQLRYRFFAEVVKAGRVTRVAVAHTADDQAETLLAHLLRGTGPTGLAGIYPVAGPVVRPLLEIRRSALREYLAGRQQGWSEDETNLDLGRLRARIRHLLLPRLEKDFQPAVVKRLSELAALARGEEVFWAALLDERFRALVRETPEGLSVRVPDLLAPLELGPVRAGRPPGEPLQALTRRLVRRIIEGLKGDRRQLSAQHVDSVIRLATGSTSGRRIHLPAGVVVERSFDQLIFSWPDPSGARSGRGHETGAAPPAYEYEVALSARGSAEVSIPEIGRRFCLKVIDWSAAGSETRSLADALDADRVRPPVVLRNWRPGDAYRPRGSRGVRKLKRLFLDHRIAARERAGWPVLTSAGQLVWARGLPAADGFTAGAGTRNGLLIAEEAL